MTRPDLLLATDLDGTFLGGTEEQRHRLYRRLDERGDVLLVFVTGRDIDFIAELIATPGIPRPRYIIGDVGTSVYDGETLYPIAEIEADIAARWKAANTRVTTLLEGEPGLTLQPAPFRNRVSYHYDPALLTPRTIDKVRRAGFDCLLSAERFLDVLPAGVAKGPTLARLVEWLSFERYRVVVAGDTLNDLSLFETAFKGIAVGNSEPALIEAIAERPTVYHSPLPGAAGISDGLHHFGFETGILTGESCP